jgi:D-alanyl-D-alanine carboxypeptidase
MPSDVDDQPRLMILLEAWLRCALAFLPVLLLVACAGSGGYGGQALYAPTHYYPPPGPPDDPWGPYINEAAARYGIPAQWIRAVMQQESGGEEQAVSPVGAMGLMQLMPETYQMLEASEGLGTDPFAPRDNIMAGAAYIKQMYDRYGAPGFLAAYNAGPEDLDAYLAGTQPLPTETVNYLADVTPNLGTQIAFSGPLANYAAANAGPAGPPSEVDFATGCDVNAAYDPQHPCSAASPAPGAGPVVLAVNEISAGSCDANAAYDPDAPCTVGPAGQTGTCNLNAAYDPASPCVPGAAPQPAPAAAQMASASEAACDPDAAYDPGHPCLPASSGGAGSQGPPRQPRIPSAVVAESALYQPATMPARAPVLTAAMAVAPAHPVRAETRTETTDTWAIQVGAFSTLGLARTVAEGARAQLPAELQAADIALPATTPFGGLVLYRARLVHLSAGEALAACSALSRRQLPCVVLRGAAS